jgi:undecaprenyl pyrophosphate phosphatase UppP
MLRHGHIGIAVATVLLIVSAIFFHDNEDAMSAAGVMALVVCFGIYLFLNERERRGQRSQGESAD